jgi:hypothetical protein
MFIENKYTKWYYNIIYRAKSRERIKNDYYEKHHIIPRSLGGNDDKENLIELTAREHFVCHLLLTKMLTGNEKYKMVFALSRMLHKNKKHNRYSPSSRIYELSRKYRSEAIGITHKGIPESAESNQKRSAALKGKKLGPQTEEHRKKLSLIRKGKPSKNKGGSTSLKGLTYEQIYGEERSKLLKENKSKKLIGRQFSKKTKSLWSKNRKGRNTKGENSNACPVEVNGIFYSCKKEAQEKLGLSLYKLNRLLKK